MTSQLPKAIECTLPLVVPFHNERRRLPRLIARLREQCPHGVTVVFVDNASTDGGTGLVQACDEVRTGHWVMLTEPSIGKFHAVNAATRFCVECLDARYVAFLDADSEFEEGAWFERTLDLVARNGTALGYVHSPTYYPELQILPCLFRAYLAYESTLREIARDVGWLASGNGFLCSADVLRRYFRDAEATTEFDLRCSLYALADGLEPHFNATRVVASARRSLASQANLDAWCFYRREFYAAKDINAAVKQDLDRRGELVDLTPEKVETFFVRRACKITSRHLVPFLVFDGRRETLARAEEVFGIPIEPGELSSLARFRSQPKILLGGEFESVIRAIEVHPTALRIGARIAERMRRRYEVDLSAGEGATRTVTARGAQRRSMADGPVGATES